MSPGKLTLTRSNLIRYLEKTKAGLGTAGITAIAVEVIAPRLLGGFFIGTLSYALPAAAAAIAALAAIKYTDVSDKEIEFVSKAVKESNAVDAGD